MRTRAGAGTLASALAGRERRRTEQTAASLCLTSGAPTEPGLRPQRASVPLTLSLKLRPSLENP